MKSVKIIFLVVSIAVFSSICTGDENNDKTLNVKGRCVIFFGLPQNEFDSYSEEDQDEINEAISDFYYYCNEALPFLKEKGINYYFTAMDNIQIKLQNNKTITYERKNNKHIVGVILTDGKNPKVHLSIETDYLNIFKDYFKIK
ncbi:MAG: hypothetical protein GY760_15535 [Deltaproteobacteria bacterium]|nr:hypothetical protein [Deltaproteobacteria bacterium]